MRRRSLLAVVVVAVLALAALMPAVALAEGAAHGQQGVHTTVSSGGLEIESERVWCATAAACTSSPGYDIYENYTGPAQGFYAFAGAYRTSNASPGTPSYLVGECDRYWTDSMGVYHLDYVDVHTYSVSGTAWLMNSGSESNTDAMAMINAVGIGSGGFLKIQGYGQFNNDSDMPYAGTNFTVTIIGTVFHQTLDPNGLDYWVDGPNTFGSMSCQTQPEPTNSLFPPFQNQPYAYGEAETSEYNN